VKIQVRYRDTTKTPVVTYEVYADGLRIGFVKLDASRQWRAVQWVHRLIGHFMDRPPATKAVIETYVKFRKQCTKKQAQTFDTKAVRLK